MVWKLKLIHLIFYLLAGDTLAALVELGNAAERLGGTPEAWRFTPVVMLAKPSGGFRPTALLQWLPRWWGGTRRAKRKRTTRSNRSESGGSSCAEERREQKMRAESHKWGASLAKAGPWPKSGLITGPSGPERPQH